MELSRLRAFVTVVQSGSFTRAADLLRTQKARVSRQIGELEAELGVRLLERTTRALRLTEIGREVHARAVGILAAVEDTERVAQASRGEPQGLLRVTMPMEFGLLGGFAWVRTLLAQHPALSIEVDSSTRIVDLVHEGFDLAIRVGPLQDSRLAARRLGTLRYGLYAAPSYLRERGAPDDPAALAGHVAVAFAPGGRVAPMRLRGPAGERVDIDMPPRLRVDSRFAQRDAALEGLGIADLLESIAAADIAAGRLLPVLPAWRGDDVPVHAVFPSARFLTPSVRAFIEHAVAHFPA